MSGFNVTSAESGEYYLQILIAENCLCNGMLKDISHQKSDVCLP